MNNDSNYINTSAPLSLYENTQYPRVGDQGGSVTSIPKTDNVKIIVHEIDVLHELDEDDSDEAWEVDNTTGKITITMQDYHKINLTEDNILDLHEVVWKYCSKCKKSYMGSGCPTKHSRKRDSFGTKMYPFRHIPLVKAKKEIDYVARLVARAKMMYGPSSVIFVVEGKNITIEQAAQYEKDTGRYVTILSRLFGGMKPNKQEPPLKENRVINDLMIINNKPRDNEYREKPNKNILKRKIQRYCKLGEQIHNLQALARNNVPGNSNFYVTKKAIFTGDPAWKEDPDSTTFEDQLELARYAWVVNQNPITSLDKCHVRWEDPEPSGTTINLMTNWKNTILKVWLPAPMGHNRKLDYACRVVDNNIVYAYPYLSIYRLITVPNTLRATGESHLIFNEFEWMSDSVLYTPLEHECVVNTVKLSIPDYLLAYTSELFGSKQNSNYTVTKYLEDVNRMHEKTANSMFDKPSMEVMLAAFFEIMKRKQVALTEHIGLNIPSLRKQYENSTMLSTLPRTGTASSVIKALLSYIIPSAWQPEVNSWVDGFKWLGLSGGLEALLEWIRLKWKEIKHIFSEKGPIRVAVHKWRTETQEHEIEIVDVKPIIEKVPPQQDENCIDIDMSYAAVLKKPKFIAVDVKTEMIQPNSIIDLHSPVMRIDEAFTEGKSDQEVQMLAFKRFGTWSIVIEEIIKTIPFGSVFITALEAYNDKRDGIFSGMRLTKRILFHCWVELLPLPIRLLTLPLRMLFHYFYNKWVESKTPPPKVRPFGNRDEFEEPVNNFNIVNKHDTYPRFIESIDVPIPVDHVLTKEFELMKAHVVPGSETMLIHVTANPIVNNVSGAKNDNNLINAILKRNLQPRPLRKLTKLTISEYEVAYTTMKLDLNPITTQTWIDLPNHGSKKHIYQKAWDQFQLDSKIDYESTLQLKLDEIVFKRLKRTINAFDPSFVVNVAPSLHSYSTALKNHWNGYINVSPSPKFTLHILYVSGYTDIQLAQITKDNMMIGGSVPHYFLKVLGDDTALSHRVMALCGDFSRYDSTQHDYHTELIRRLLRDAGLDDAADHLKRASSSNVKVFSVANDKMLKFPTVGFKTGSPETSVSNTTVTGLTVIAALFHASKVLRDMTNVKNVYALVEDYMNNRAGFIFKASRQSYSSGVEFLKKLSVIQGDTLVTVPLLSSLAKIGKFLTEPRLIVPLSKAKSKSQIAIEATYMQLKGKGDVDKIPGWKIWFNKLKTYTTTEDVHLERYKQPILTEEVNEETMELVYLKRYGVEWQDVLYLFQQLALVHKHEYPFNYTSQVLWRAVEIDYGPEIFDS